jgi:enoyl-CoA hydratase
VLTSERASSGSGSSVALGRRDSVAVLLLGRPPINGLDQATLDLLGQAITEVGHDSQIRALVVGSSIDGVFCSGGDLTYWLQIEDGRHVGGAGRSVFGLIERLPKPTVAAIDGHVVGDGVGLALACDLRVASTRAKFRLPELAYGFIPGWGTIGRLVRTIGRSRTADLLLTGREIEAVEAHAIGLVNDIVAGVGVVEAAVACAADVARNSSTALRAAKAALSGDDEATLFEAVWGSDDWRLGMAAAFERRRAAFHSEEEINNGVAR